jgi:hypothetical protein
LVCLFELAFLVCLIVIGLYLCCLGYIYFDWVFIDWVQDFGFCCCGLCLSFIVDGFGCHCFGFAIGFVLGWLVWWGLVVWLGRVWLACVSFDCVFYR